jgi:hypothetical protein
MLRYLHVVPWAHIAATSLEVLMALADFEPITVQCEVHRGDSLLPLLFRSRHKAAGKGLHCGQPAAYPLANVTDMTLVGRPANVQRFFQKLYEA